MELGVYSFGDVQRDPQTGALGSTAEAQRNLLEAIQLADQVGLDYFGIGEHHRTRGTTARDHVLEDSETRRSEGLEEGD